MERLWLFAARRTGSHLDDHIESADGGSEPFFVLLNGRHGVTAVTIISNLSILHPTAIEPLLTCSSSENSNAAHADHGTCSRKTEEKQDENRQIKRFGKNLSRDFANTLARFTLHTRRRFKELYKLRERRDRRNVGCLLRDRSNAFRRRV